MLIPDTTQTIVAPASAPGPGAIAVIRLSGPRAFKTAAAFLKPSSVLKDPKHRHSYLLNAIDDGRVLDRTVAVFYRSPKSYTGDDMAEIFCHGSPYIVSRLLHLAIANGAREAAPGEFTLRAFVNGKLDLAQAEAVNDLIISENKAAHRAAITQLEGNVSGRVKTIRASLIDLLSELEIRLDDSYDEIPPLNPRTFRRSADSARNEIKDLASSFEKGRYIKHGIRVAIAGAPNSGKSSLLNRITGSDRAIVSPVAGTTRDTIEEKLTLSGLTVIFTDTAGINPKTPDIVEREGMRRAIKALKTSDIVLWVRDISKRNSAADSRVGTAIENGAAPGSRIIHVFNKSDLAPARPPLETEGGIKLSCRTGRGIEDLKRLIVREEEEAASCESSSIITSARHYSALLAAAKELEKLEALYKEPELPVELVAEHLRGALNALADIIGETTSEDILANIFKNFCVGK